MACSIFYFLKLFKRECETVRICVLLIIFVLTILQTRRSAFFCGIKDIFPAVAGLIPFGMITGAAATAAGMDPWLAMAMSMIVYAGASQLAAISLLTLHAPALIVVATVLVVNLRFMMYSASVAPHLRHLRARQKWLFAYLLVDHSFAMLNLRFPPGGTENISSQHRAAYYFGISSFLWVMWQITTAIGIFAGTKIPANWSLDFAIPLIFLALVLPALQTRAHWLTALVASMAAVFTSAMPLKLGLIAAAVAGVSIGVWLDSRTPVKTVESI